MKLHKLRYELVVPVSVRDAFELMADPKHWPELFPPTLQFRLHTPTSATLRTGAEFEYRLRRYGLQFGWKTRITDFEPPFFFIDERIAGPFAYWRHRHDFRPSPEGAIISDRIEYAMPLGPLGDLLHSVWLRQELEATFRHRQETAMQLLGGHLLAV